MRPSTPLTGITSTISAVVGDHAATLGRGGVVVAVSSGLVTGVGLPASAAVHSSDAVRTTAVPLLPASADALASAPLTAPAKARLTFEHSAFTTVAKAATSGSTTSASVGATATREVASISRSLARAAYRAAHPGAAAASTTRTSATTGSGAGSGSTASSDVDGDDEDGQTATPPAPPSDGTTASVVAIAMRYLGIAYRYGGTSPRGFDCSGFTQYVFGQVGQSLPRTADQQLRATTRISRSEARAGDLVFFLGGGYAYHVGIYLGNGKMIDSPRTGQAVSVRSVYSANVVFTRV
ncbi:MAG TPA: NlpC/P60 family protein [Kineosporiaceae bacterium]|nr:NlpC/P60 family protein [Kineosporiaceae bacterium]